jgi:hypothetical protein
LPRTRPKAQIPFRPKFSQSQGERTANQPRAEDGNRAQGTRKILFVYGHLTSVPGGNPRTST